MTGLNPRNGEAAILVVTVFNDSWVPERHGSYITQRSATGSVASGLHLEPTNDRGAGVFEVRIVNSLALTQPL